MKNSSYLCIRFRAKNSVEALKKKSSLKRLHKTEK